MRFTGKIIDKEVMDIINKYNNEHILYFWDELNENERNNLIHELKSIDFDKLNEYYNYYLNQKNKVITVDPTDYLSIEQKYQINGLKDLGIDALKKNKVGFLTVAGGQGSRLGYEHPKGCFPVSTVKKKSLFQVFAEKIKFYSNYYDNDFNWYIMTSEYNYQETIDFFKHHKYFGLKENQVIFYKQGMLPSLTLDGKLILKDKSSIFRNPDGHGGILKALLKKGLLDEMQDKGIEYLSYFQVDNPLVDMADPYYIGYHIKEKSEVSSKVIPKLYPEERLGAICKMDGINGVIEYSDLPKDKMYEKNENGVLKYLMGSIAIHIFNVDFLIHFTRIMPIHFAKKKIRGYKMDNGRLILSETEGIKFETFVFDSIPYAKKSVFFETERESEFFPLKNKTGIDSIETCIEGQNKEFYRWIRDAGIWQRDYEGENVEISPLYAPSKEIFLTKAAKDGDKLRKAVYDNRGKINENIYIE